MDRSVMESIVDLVIGILFGLCVGATIVSQIGDSPSTIRYTLAREIADGKVRIEVHDWPDGKRDVRIVEVKQEPRP